eukprot:2863831-Rhodomonas_salina.1
MALGVGRDVDHGHALPHHERDLERHEHLRVVHLARAALERDRDLLEEERRVLHLLPLRVRDRAPVVERAEHAADGEAGADGVHVLLEPDVAHGAVVHEHAPDHEVELRRDLAHLVVEGLADY